MYRFRHIVFAVTLLSIFCSCTHEPEKEQETLAVQKITDTTSFQNDVYGYGNKEGALGVFDVPEMLVLSIMDSAASVNVAKRMTENYAVLGEELTAIGAEMNGPVGMITYNNDVTNFKFENTLFIKRLPAKQPKLSKIVVLESSKMLVFNFYGSYQTLFLAYDKIRQHCTKAGLTQTGPMREFYITDPEQEKDPKKWLTRIMVPVATAEVEKE